MTQSIHEKLFRIAAELGGKKGMALLVAAGIREDFARRRMETQRGQVNARSGALRRIIEAARMTAPAKALRCFVIGDSCGLSRPPQAVLRKLDIKECIAEAAKGTGYRVVKSAAKNTMDTLASSHAVVAILRGNDTGVYLHLGMAAALGKKVIILALPGAKIPSEIGQGNVFHVKTDRDSKVILRALVEHFEASAANESPGEKNAVSYFRSAHLLKNIYRAKKYVLGQFWNAMVRVARELEKDFELPTSKRDALQDAAAAIANLLAEPASIYLHQCLCLHETVREAIELPGIEREHCDKVCAAMDKLAEDAQNWVDDFSIPRVKISLPSFKERINELICAAAKCENLRKLAHDRLSSYL